MDQLRSPSVIKLFFEIDDSKAALSMDQLLNTNESQAKRISQLESTVSAQNLELQESKIKIQQLSDANKAHERNKKADDMALAAFKALKHDSMLDITRLQTEVKNLKLDLLAERELRRIHQGRLRGFDPQNDDYNPDSVEITLEDKPSTLGGGLSMIANGLSVEAKPPAVESEASTVSSSEETPAKLVKSTSAPVKMLDKIKFPGPRKPSEKPLKIFMKPSDDNIRSKRTAIGFSDMPSTSSQGFSFQAPSAPNIKFNGKPVSFGDGPAFPAPMPSTSSEASKFSKFMEAGGTFSLLGPKSPQAGSTAAVSSEASTSNNLFTGFKIKPSVTPPFFRASTLLPSNTTLTTSHRESSSPNLNDRQSGSLFSFPKASDR